MACWFINNFLSTFASFDLNHKQYECVFLNELNTYAKKNSEKNNIYTILNWRTHVEGNNETGTTPTQRATKQTDDAYWQSFFYFAHDGPTVQNKNKNKFLEPTHLWIKRHGALLLWAQRTQSQPQCTLSGENNSKGRGAGGVYALNLMYAQRMRMVIKLKQNYNTTKLRVFNDT